MELLALVCPDCRRRGDHAGVDCRACLAATGAGVVGACGFRAVARLVAEYGSPGTWGRRRLSAAGRAAGMVDGNLRVSRSTAVRLGVDAAACRSGLCAGFRVRWL